MENKPDLAKILENRECKLYFVGIGGIAMSATACLAKEAGFEVEGRDSEREYSVGAKVILQMYNKYLKPKSPEYNIGLKDAILVDIDGTLARMNGRGPYDWEKVGTDLLNRTIAEIVTKYKNSNTKVIIVSGRDEKCREITKNWLHENYVGYDFLFMRPEGNNEEDSIIKRRIYENEIKDKYNVLFVLDDRDRVVAMWRSLGLTCLQVDYGNF
jgi:hypothetical protein